MSYVKRRKLYIGPAGKGQMGCNLQWAVRESGLSR